MAYTGPCVSKIAKRCPWITTSPRPQTSLHIRNTCERDSGRVATVAYFHTRLGPFKLGYEQQLQHSNTMISCVESDYGVLQIWNWKRCKSPSPELTELELLSESGPVPVVPDSFLGGYPPHLQSVSLTRISFSFPVLRRLPLSATHLVDLYL